MTAHSYAEAEFIRSVSITKTTSTPRIKLESNALKNIFGSKIRTILDKNEILENIPFFQRENDHKKRNLESSSPNFLTHEGDIELHLKNNVEYKRADDSTRQSRSASKSSPIIDQAQSPVCCWPTCRIGVIRVVGMFSSHSLWARAFRLCRKSGEGNQKIREGFSSFISYVRSSRWPFTVQDQVPISNTPVTCSIWRCSNTSSSQKSVPHGHLSKALIWH